MDLEEKAVELMEKQVESTERSAGKQMDPKGDADAPSASLIAKNKKVALSTTPKDPPQASSEHVSFAHPL